MTPVFDASCRHVAWLDSHGYVFDHKLKWIAFLEDGHAWSAASTSWLGSFHQGNFLDRHGLVVAWTNTWAVENYFFPLPPMPPSPADPPPAPEPQKSPAQPIPPLAPEGGFSDLDFKTWLQQPRLDPETWLRS